MKLTVIFGLTIFLFCSADLFAQVKRADVCIVTGEAEAVLAILEKRKAKQPVTEGDWKKIFESEGCIRFKKREESLKRAFWSDEIIAALKNQN